MAKEKPADVGAQPAATPTAEPGGFKMTVDEFCARLSAIDNRVEMVGAFHAQEKSAGRKSDTEAAYKTRFDTFCNAPA